MLKLFQINSLNGVKHHYFDWICVRLFFIAYKSHLTHIDFLLIIFFASFHFNVCVRVCVCSAHALQHAHTIGNARKRAKFVVQPNGVFRVFSSLL